MRDRDRRRLAYIRTCLHQASVSTLRQLWWYCSHWKEWSHSKIGCNPILEQLHCFQSEQYRRVVGVLILSLGVKGPLIRTLQYWLKGGGKHCLFAYQSLSVSQFSQSFFFGISGIKCVQDKIFWIFYVQIHENLQICIEFSEISLSKNQKK